MASGGGGGGSAGGGSGSSGGDSGGGKEIEPVPWEVDLAQFKVELPAELLQFLTASGGEDLELLSKIFGDSSSSTGVASSATSQGFASSLSNILGQQVSFIKTLVSDFDAGSGGTGSLPTVAVASSGSNGPVSNNAFLRAVSQSRAVTGSQTTLSFPSVRAGSTRASRYAIAPAVVAAPPATPRSPASFEGTPHRDQAEEAPAVDFGSRHRKK